MRSTLFAVFLIFIAIHPSLPAQEVPATWLQAPAGFRVTHFATDELATDIYCLTTDRLGRVVVAGPGYIKILIDENGDGQAESARLFSDRPRNGAMGLCFDGTDLLCVGDEGLLRFRDENQDDQADGPPEVLLRFKTGGEHDSHAIRRGPDGWWYLISGNYSGVGEELVTSARSPIKSPVAGILARISPDFQVREILADGMRNAYDFDFDQDGNLFVYDSDGERDVSLPWYQPTRVYRLHPGAHAGWVSRSWKQPDEFFDMPTVAARLGRGSPTGVVCYRHWQFPQPYRNATFVLDWTFGRIIVVRLKSDENSEQRFEHELFVSGKGTHGFAPTDACVGPDGSLYVSVGGRSTQGSVYRIRYSEAAEGLAPVEAPATLVDCLDLPQPESAWSRMLAGAFLDTVTREQLEEAIFNSSLSVRQRIRAVELITSKFGSISKPALARLTEIDQPAVLARLAWSVCLQPIHQIEAPVLFRFLNHDSNAVRIAAMESLTGNQNAPSFLAEPLLECLRSDNIHLQKAAAEFMRASRFDPLDYLPAESRPAADSLPIAYWMGKQMRKTSLNIAALKFSLEKLQDTQDSRELLNALRLFQLSLGDVGPAEGLPEVFESYRARQALPVTVADSARSTLEKLLDHEDPAVVRETIRCLAMGRLAQGATGTRLLSMISEQSHPEQDIHRLAALAHSQYFQPAQRAALAQAILGIQPKIDRLELNQDRNWEPRFREIVSQLVQLDRELAVGWVEQGINSRGQIFLFQWVPDEIRIEAIDRFITTLKDNDAWEVDSDLMNLLASTSHSPHWEIIRKASQSPQVRDTVIELLARKPYEADREKFVTGLASSQVKTVRIAAQSLLKLESSQVAEEQFALLNAMKRMSPDSEGWAAREWVMRVLQRNMGRSFGFVFGSQGHHAQAEVLDRWTRFLTEQFPEAAKKQLGDQRFDVSALASRLQEVDWESGDVERGRGLYSTLSCAKCHGSRNRLGPDLSGVTRRFSQADLFRAIADPSYQVPSRYQTTLFETADGRYHSGIIIYDSVDGVLLRDSDNQTLRIESKDIVRRRQISRSLMPENLLDEVDAQGLADLYQYLKSL